MLCVVSFVAGTVLWFLGGLEAVDSWHDVPMDEAMWEAWCVTPLKERTTSVVSLTFSRPPSNRLLVLSSSAQSEANGYYVRCVAGVLTAVGVVFTCCLTAMLTDTVRTRQNRCVFGATV